MKEATAILALFVWPCLAAGQDAGGIAGTDLPLLRDFRAMRASSNNVDPASNDDSKRVIPGETVVLADLRGPGEVTHMWITVAANEYGWPRLVRLRIYYDGSAVPSVDAPLGDFFAVGHGLERSINSLMIRNTSNGRSRNSYWRMPFRKSCKITITNEGRRRVHALYYHVDWRKLASLPGNAGYFHARYRQMMPAETGKPLEFVRLEGRGQYVGTVFSVVQVQPGWFGEGDERIYVDGDPKPVIEGTGTEDYFNDAWSLRVADGPYTGVPVADGTTFAGARMTAYRWHVTDPIPFGRSLRFDMEHAGWTYHADGRVRSGFEERPDLFSIVAFWYQQGIAQNQPEPPYGAARLPHGNARQIEVENLIEGVKADRGRAEVQKEVFWSRDLLHFQAKEPGAAFDIPFDVEQDGRYELLAQVAHAPDYGIYETWLDGKPLGQEVQLEHEPGANLGGGTRIDAYRDEIYVAEDHLLAWRELSRGRHTLSFRCVGKNQLSAGYDLGVDTLILSRVGEPQKTGGATAAELRRMGERGDASGAQVRQGLTDPDPFVREAAAWALTQSSGDAARSAPLLAKALEDGDPVVRGLAAVALRNCGGCAESAMSGLIKGIQGDDPNVRIACADAIAQLGPKGAPAIDALIQAAQAPGQHAHVLRSVATALGAIGPAAERALPALEHLQENIRARWAGRAAIASIKGRQPPDGPEPAP
jgi:hypothetical protein